jgi:hypothetical protein
MRIKPEILHGSKGIEVVQASALQVILSQPLLPFYPPIVFAVVCIAAFTLLFFLWQPGSWLESLLMFSGLGFLLYVLAAYCFNSTILTVTGSGLKWEYGPIPWLRGGMIDKDLIEAVTTKSLSNRANKRGKAFSYYSIGVKGRGSGHIIILPLMQSAWTAEMTAQVIAGYLGDVPVESDQAR